MELEPPSTSLLTQKDNFSTYHKWLIIYHHLRFNFSVLKSFIRNAEERALFLEIEWRFTSSIGTKSTFPLTFLSLMFQLFEIECALKLRRKNMDFLWVERSMLLDDVILLMPLLMKPLQPKKCLTMNFLPIPTFVALVLGLPPMPIYLDLRKNSCYGTGNLGSRSSCIPSRLMNPLAFAMKCLLSSLPSSNLLQISSHLLFVSPVNWLVLNVVCPKLTNQ